jgi:hypothetical protein
MEGGGCLISDSLPFFFKKATKKRWKEIHYLSTFAILSHLIVESVYI